MDLDRGVIKTTKIDKLRQLIKESIKNRERAGSTINRYGGGKRSLTHLGFPPQEITEGIQMSEKVNLFSKKALQ